MVEQDFQNFLQSELASFPGMGITVVLPTSFQLRPVHGNMQINVPFRMDADHEAGRVEARYVVAILSDEPLPRRARALFHEFGHIDYFWRVARKDFNEEDTEYDARVYCCRKLLQHNLVDSMKLQVLDTAEILANPTEFPAAHVNADRRLVKHPVWEKVLKEIANTPL